MIRVEVVYAKPHKQWLIAITLAATCTIENAILQSGILEKCPEINLTSQKVGIFGKRCNLCDLINDGDRIEIYRPLLIDPKEARRTKAKHARV